MDSNDYEINYQDYYNGDFISLGSGEYCSVRFDGVGSPDLRESTFDISGGDGYLFGIEYFSGITWNITGGIHGGVNKNAPGSAELAWERWSQLSRAWTGYPERLTTRGVVPLYFKRPGRESMVVYGRPNRIDPDQSRSYSGFISYTATFRQSDPKFYSSDEASFSLQLETPYAGGLRIDNTGSVGFLLPFQTTQATPKTGAIVVAGDTETNPIIAIKGPVTNPRVTYFNPIGDVGWVIRLNKPVPSGTTVTIDTRSWQRSIIDQNGVSYAGAYIGERLKDIEFAPGVGYVEYLGTDATATSTCTVTYRNAWRSS